MLASKQKSVFAVKSRLILVVLLFFFCLATIIKPAQATIYNPGDTLNPDCTATSTNCGISTNWAGNWQSKNYTDFLASSTTYLANNSGNWLGTWQSKNYTDFLASSTSYQTLLVSASNIKTINSNALLGAGDISLASLIGYTPYNATNPDGYIATSTGTWLGTWQAKNYTDFLASSTTYIANNSGNWAGTFQNYNYTDFLASSTSYQTLLVSASNIKTINSNALLGAGDISLASLIGYTPYNATNPDGYIATSTGTWLGTWQAKNYTDFLASSTTYIANNSGNWAGTFQNYNYTDFLASSTSYQTLLVSASNIKTINSNALLGAGDISLASLIGYTPYNATNPDGYIATSTGTWLGTWQAKNYTDFLASSTTYIANNSGNWAGTFQNYNYTDFAASTTASSQWTTSAANIYYNSGNVGIGTTNPGAQISIFSSGTSDITLDYDGGAGTGSNIDFRFIDPSVSAPVTSRISAVDDGAYRQNIIFWTKTSATAASGLSERFMIKADGKVGIANTNPGTALDVTGTIQQSTVKSCANGLKTDASGGITSCVASDERLKKDITDLNFIDSAITLVSRLKPVTYKWINTLVEDSLVHAGFIAQEVERVLPEAIVGGGTDVDGNVMKAVDANAMVSLLTKAVQEIISIFDKIENGVAYIKEVVITKVTIGSTANPAGITLYDEATGSPYCVKISNGQMVNTPGECGDGLIINSSMSGLVSNSGSQNATLENISITESSPATPDITTSTEETLATSTPDSVATTTEPIQTDDSASTPTEETAIEESLPAATTTVETPLEVTPPVDDGATISEPGSEPTPTVNPESQN